ncbi:vacuolar protein sorting-associated protein 18 homolog isoform X2 [Cimex lectularius]|uniref:Vacuolar protein sorting-associated protein 18 homolog n=1 Tax=Cimex lectularius TaxID=79782 RepID=A0A8I6S9E4_CIMLE|nr:vacuolar protein sorting-associated protein 18 homolog isoform X2 [Cimex lectularius]
MFVKEFEDDEPPMFQKVKTKFDPPDRITHLVVSNDFKVLAMSNNVLLRVDLQRQKSGDSKTEIDLNRIVPGVKLVGLFLDPTGEHLFISFSTELLYFNKKYNKPKPVGKMKGHEVTAVAWHPANSGIAPDMTTRPILLGTVKGEIYEMQINPEQDSFRFQSGELYCKRVFDMGQKKGQVITGLEFHKMEKSDHYFVIVSTQEFLYHYVGKVNNIDDRPLLQPLFNQYISSTVQESVQYLPGKLETSRLQLYRTHARAVPNSLCWQTSLGIFCVEINHSSPLKLLSRNKMYSFPTEESPVSFLKTEFHILLLYADRIEGISLLSENVVFKDYFSEIYGPLVNICRDLVTGKIWLYAQRAIFMYDVHEEDRHVWLIYAEKGEYEIAKKFCKGDVFKKDKVLRMQADYHFARKEYDISAVFYAETQASFEKIALKFLEVENNEALKLFLKKKLLGLNQGDKAQMTMLVLWVIELLLSQLGELKTKGKDNTIQYSQIQQELDEFLLLESSQECILKNRQAIYGLMFSHGDQENMIKIAKATGDYDKVVSHHINQGECFKALEVLNLQHRNKKLWYQYIPSLLQEEPTKTLAALRMMGKDLDPILILPSLIAESSTRPYEMIKYLEFCTNELNCQEQAIHNFLLFLLVKYSPEKLMTYLKLQGEELSMVNYDVRYGIRLCRQFDRKEACVKLSSLLGLWESAVELALSVSSQLAVQTVQSSHCSPSLQRKLWLSIAKHVVMQEKEGNISQVMNFLKQCDLIKIEDILPFFPNYPTIDYFKDAICSSLQEYNQRIEDLKEEMQDATKSAEVVRNEIQSFRTRHTIIKWNTNCFICKLQLLMRPFYAFPCGHFFHFDCLVTELKPLLPQKQQESLQSLRRQESSQTRTIEKEKVRAQIDSILAAQCLYCGDIMIDLIDVPFIKDEDYERLKKEWE